MNKLFLVAIYDNKLQFFQRPILVNDLREAIRSFVDTVNGTGTPLAENPQDYDLYQIGEITLNDDFDDMPRHEIREHQECLYQGKNASILKEEPNL